MAESGRGPLIPLFNELQHVSPRWCTLFLKISPLLYPTFLGEVTCAPTPETLKLDHFLDEDEDFHLPHTPLLKDLDIQLFIPLSSIYIDWSSLTTVVAEFRLMEEFFDVLRLAERLASFRLRLTGYQQCTRISPFTHSALRELYLDTDPKVPPEVVTMLNLATFPSLEKFGYYSESSALFPNSAIPSIFNRSHYQLTHFDLCGDLQNGTPEDLISILSDLPTITHFKLQEESESERLNDALMSNMLLRRLTPIRPSEFTHTERLLPRLESLEFLGYKGFSWSCLASFVSAVTLDRSPNLRTTPERPECTNSIRRISFKVYGEEELEHVDAQSLIHFKAAHRAGIFRCQLLWVEFGGWVYDPFSGVDDLS